MAAAFIRVGIHPISSGQNMGMFRCRYVKLPSISDMDGECHERPRVEESPDVVCDHAV